MKTTGLLFTPDNYTKTARGEKTMTRRLTGLELVNAAPDAWMFLNIVSGGRALFKNKHGAEPVHLNCPYGTVGDQLFCCIYIPGVPHTYCAGGDGQIYSRARGDWRPLKSHSGNPYPAVTIMDGVKKRTRNIHTLICSAFYGPRPFPRAQVRHLDGDYYNSRPDNLCWGTQIENWNDRKAHGNGCEGEKHHAAKFTDKERAHIRWAIERGLVSQHHAARMLGLRQGAINELMSGAELRPAEQDLPKDRLPPLLLELTEVRVERLWDISAEDCRAEGVAVGGEEEGHDFHYMNLYESIYGPGSWDANLWLWILSYRKLTK